MKANTRQHNERINRMRSKLGTIDTSQMIIKLKSDAKCKKWKKRQQMIEKFRNPAFLSPAPISRAREFMSSRVEKETKRHLSPEFIKNSPFLSADNQQSNELSSPTKFTVLKISKNTSKRPERVNQCLNSNFDRTKLKLSIQKQSNYQNSEKNMRSYHQSPGLKCFNNFKESFQNSPLTQCNISMIPSLRSPRLRQQTNLITVNSSREKDRVLESIMYPESPILPSNLEILKMIVERKRSAMKKIRNNTGNDGVIEPNCGELSDIWHTPTKLPLIDNNLLSNALK